jgi:hypothetical protein
MMLFSTSGIARILPLLQKVQTGSGAHEGPYLIDIRVLSYWKSGPA